MSDTTQTSSSEYLSPLEKLLDEGGIVATLRKRIANLEEFRDRYLDISSPSLNTHQGNNDPELSQKLSEQAQLITSLESQLKELHGCQSILESEIERLTEENQRISTQSRPSNNDEKEALIEKLERQIQELSGCQAILESEIERLSGGTEENDQSLIESLQNEVAQMSEVAFTAIRSNANLGAVIHLLTNTFECQSTEELATFVTETLHNQSLNGLFSFFYNDNHEIHTTTEAISSQDEINLIKSLSASSPLLETEQHLGYYTRHFQLLVKGFDNSDFKAYNDIKDMLQMFSTGMNASTRRILSEAIAEKERSNLHKLVVSTQKNLHKIEHKLSQKNEEISKLTNTTVTKFQKKVSTLAIDPESKKLLTSLLVQEMATIEEALNQSTLIDSNFKKVIDSLTKSLNKP